MSRGAGRQSVCSASGPAWPDSARRQPLPQASDEPPVPSALDDVVTVFALSPFERDVLLLCAGVELDASLRHCVPPPGAIHGALTRPSAWPWRPCRAHWSALTPLAPCVAGA